MLNSNNEKKLKLIDNEFPVKAVYSCNNEKKLKH